ncbi:hypothetical protein ALC57_01388 [Trachymyrmex cornetzi]|uniref:Uncharacterized protein n=1 Tax=Trachymyrmex cornetzi TaxID=471704 RepID=A0A195ELV9_9HYME|nr:hypothetical protein ALC57_01388 [Trachymyrmex cornetzi]
MTTEVAPGRNGDRGAVTGLPVQFDNALNVHFPRARPCVRIRNPPPAAPVARWPMTDAHGVKVNVSPTGDTLLRGKCNPNFGFNHPVCPAEWPGLSGHSRDDLSHRKGYRRERIGVDEGDGEQRGDIMASRKPTKYDDS